MKRMISLLLCLVLCLSLLNIGASSIGLPQLGVDVLYETDSGELRYEGFTGFGIGVGSERIILPFLHSSGEAVEITVTDPSVVKAERIEGTDLYTITGLTCGYTTLTYTDNSGRTAYLDVFSRNQARYIHAFEVLGFDAATGEPQLGNEVGSVNVGTGETKIYYMRDEDGVSVTGLAAKDSGMMTVLELGNGCYEITGAADGKTALVRVENNVLCTFDACCDNAEMLNLDCYRRTNSASGFEREPGFYRGIGRPVGEVMYICPILDGVDSKDIILHSGDADILTVTRLPNTDSYWQVDFLNAGVTTIWCEVNGIRYELDMAQAYGHSQPPVFTTTDTGVEVEVFPQPGILAIVAVYDTNGKLLACKQATTHEVLELSASGIYSVRVFLLDGDDYHATENSFEMIYNR